MPLRLKIIMVLMTLAFCSAIAQPVAIEKSDRVIEKDGQEFFIHTIQKGHTVYSISRVYGVSVDDVMSANPVAVQDLSIGQELLIPKGKTSQPEPAVVSESEDGHFVYHVVNQGQTLYSISKIYGVGIDQIKARNAGLAEGLKAGDRIRIPVAKVPGKSEENAGAKYDEYLVKQGETAYGISKKFDISLDELYLLNPAVRNGIETGVKLRIPVRGTIVSASEDSLDASQHKVRKRENLSEIAEKYGVEVQDILDANPELELGMGRLPRGTMLTIPETKEDTVRTADTLKRTGNALITSEEWRSEVPCIPDKNKRDRLYRVALMLPFYSNAVDTISTDQFEAKEPSNYPSFRFIQFYEGILLAVDSLRNQGLNLKLQVYDVGGDTSKTQRLLREESLDKVDLIIGPLYFGSFEVVSRFAHQHSIPIVNPLTSRENVIDDKPLVYKAYPSEKDQMASLAGFLLETYPGAKLFLAGKDTDGSATIRAMFTDALSTAMERRNIPDSSWYDITTAGINPAPFSSELSKKELNIFITLSADQVLVFNLVRKLYAQHEDYDFIVIGLPVWEKFSGLDPDYIQALNLHTYSNSWVDYSDKNTREFIAKFRQEYHAEPDPYAYQGFDLAQFFLRGLMMYGNQFGDCMHRFEFDALQTTYRFNREGDNGYSNSFVNVYRIKDYKQVDARRYPARKGADSQEK